MISRCRMLYNFSNELFGFNGNCGSKQCMTVANLQPEFKSDANDTVVTAVSC